MMYKIIGLLIGLLIFGAGIYYLIKEKNDPSSRKITLSLPVPGLLLQSFVGYCCSSEFADLLLLLKYSH